jgi:soluble lytic murein transglycosylase-like protein
MWHGDRTMATRRRQGALFFAAAVLVAAVVVVLLARGAGNGEPRRLAPGRGATATTKDPFAYDPARQKDFEQRAAAGLAHVLYDKSPGGVIATAQRTARFRPLIDQVAKRGGVDPNTLEAIVFLESAGRPDARASNDLTSAVGLTQILAETGTSLLGLKVDVAGSERLTRRLADRSGGSARSRPAAAGSTSASTRAARSRAPRAT